MYSLRDLKKLFPLGKKDPGREEAKPLPPYHMYGFMEVERLLKTSISEGLTDEEAATRREEHGFNELPEAEGKKMLIILLRQFYNTPTLVLFLAAAIALQIEDWIAAGSLAVVLVFNSLVGFLQEYHAEVTVSSLRKTSSSTARVTRNGGLTFPIPSRELVPGDIILLSVGDKVPADARLVEDFNFEVDESALTGESLSVSKSSHPVIGDDVILADRVSMIYMGTSATNGRARAIVTATGLSTEVGNISTAIAMESRQEKQTPLGKQLNTLYMFLLVLALFLIVLVFAISKFRISSNVALYAVSLAIAIIPESLVAVITLTLSNGIKQMTKCRAVVRNMSTMVLIGAVTDICSDKTGTITAGVMRVASVIVHSEEEITVQRSTLTEPAKLLNSENVEIRTDLLSAGTIKAAECAAMCNNATVSKIITPVHPERAVHQVKSKPVSRWIRYIMPWKAKKKRIVAKPTPISSSPAVTDGDWVVSGSPTEIALVTFSNMLGVSKTRLSDPETGKYTIEVEYPFDSEIKVMSVLLREGNKGFEETMATITGNQNRESKNIRCSQKPKDERTKVLLQIGNKIVTPNSRADLRETTSSSSDVISQNEKPGVSGNGNKAGGGSEEILTAEEAGASGSGVNEEKSEGGLGVNEDIKEDTEQKNVGKDNGESRDGLNKQKNPAKADESKALPCMVVFTKGSVEAIFGTCVATWDRGANDFVKFKDLEDKKKATREVLERVERLANRGLRVLALAYKILPEEIVSEYLEKHESMIQKAPRSRKVERGSDSESVEALYRGTAEESVFKDTPRSVIECDLTFIGLVGIEDPPRPETANAIRECHRAGIVVRMLTGDHPATAELIAHQVGILSADYIPGNNKESLSINDCLVWTGAAFDSLTDRQVDTLPHLPLVISRCTPTTKVRMVNAIKRRGGVVVMTGDGINDSPSLKGAHVGVAMGRGGADTAKEASDMILTDDNFATIVVAVIQGRRIFANLVKFVSHLMITNVAEIIALVIGLSISDPEGSSVYPISPLQLLFMNMLTSSPPAMALGMEPPRKYQMISSKYRAGSVFVRPIIIDIIFYGTVMGVLTLCTFVYVILNMNEGGGIGLGCNSYYPEPTKVDGVIYGECDGVYRARSTAYVTIICLTLYQSFACRNRLQTTWHWHKTQKANYALILCVVFGIIITLPTVYIPYFAGHFFKSMPMSTEWICVLTAMLIYIVCTEVYKFILRTLESRQGLSRIDTTAEYFFDVPG